MGTKALSNFCATDMEAPANPNASGSVQVIEAGKERGNGSPESDLVSPTGTAINQVRREMKIASPSIIITKACGVTKIAATSNLLSASTLFVRSKIGSLDPWIGQTLPKLPFYNFYTRLMRIIYSSFCNLPFLHLLLICCLIS